MTDTPAKKSDLGVRTASAVVMVAIAGTALWLGGWWWAAFVALIGVGVMFEWSRLALALTDRAIKRGVWLLFGGVYVGLAMWAILIWRTQPNGFSAVLLMVCAVIAVDVGAYFSGRIFGGPKIAPKISPSKTWAGLVGGIIGAGVIIFLFPLNRAHAHDVPELWRLVFSMTMGTIVAIIAQSGDFFESWMKRRAGVKDSSSLIPGHGGLFDRVDGLLAVSFVLGILLLLSGGFEAIR